MWRGDEQVFGERRAPHEAGYEGGSPQLEVKRVFVI